MKEIWKEILGYEGLYEVSNLGKVRNMKTGRILKPRKNTRGYLYLNLYKKGTRKTAKVHRLVSQAFLPNLTNLPQVNHKDENKTNNCVDNLEWCTAQYNSTYSNSKPIIQLDKNGDFIAEYQSGVEAERNTGIHKDTISMCCRGKLKTSGGYLWKFKN